MNTQVEIQLPMFITCCYECGVKRYAKYKGLDFSKENLAGVTMSKGVCPICKESKFLIPDRDWRFAGCNIGVWD